MTFGLTVQLWLTRNCRVPTSWRLLHRQGDSWQEVPEPSAYGLEKDRFNEVTFAPITATELRLEVQLQPDFSAGVLEWRLADG